MTNNFYVYNWQVDEDTSHSAYVAMSTELHGVKIDGFLYPNKMDDFFSHPLGGKGWFFSTG